jgi:hypothetical protein
VTVTDEQIESELIQHSLADYPILAFFRYTHLPVALQAHARPVAVLALQAAGRLTRSAEVSAGLRKLLEAKDCFVRAAL